MKKTLIILTFLCIICFLIGYITGFRKREIKTVYVEVPKVVKEVEPQFVTKIKEVKVKEPCIRYWKKFSFSDEYVDISYFAYDSSSGLHYQINGEKFMFPVEIEKEVVKKYKEPQKNLYILAGLMFDTERPKEIVPMLGFRYRFFSLTTTISLKKPVFSLIFSLPLP